MCGQDSNLFEEQMKSGAIDQEKIDDFRAEMQLMRSIKPHPNIIQVLGICTGREDELCIVTEYCANGSLDKYLKSKKPLTKLMISKLLRGIAAGNSSPILC